MKPLRILFIFVDMLRAERLRTFNPKAKHDPVLDSWFSSFGGTAFTNCYTPAPDSPRSLATLYTGLYPKRNGCTQRNMWPRFFLKDTYNLFHLLRERNFYVVAREDEQTVKTGFFPPNTYEKNSKFACYEEFSDAFDAYEKAAKKHKNSCCFLCLQDYHNAADDFYGGWIAHSVAKRKLRSALTMVFDRFDKDFFDYVVLFSDHGLKLTVKERFFDDPIYSVGDARSKICMLVRKKGENAVKKEDRVCSTMDVFPMMLSLLKKTPPLRLDGKNLFHLPKKRSIVIDDYRYIQPGMHPMHDLWAVRTERAFYLATYGKRILLQARNYSYKEKKPTKAEIKKFDALLAKDSATFAQCMEDHRIQEFYDSLWSKTQLPYSDGSRRMPRWFGMTLGILSANIGLFALLWKKIKKR